MARYSGALRSAEACEAALSYSRRLVQHAAERKLGKMSLLEFTGSGRSGSLDELRRERAKS
jgi:hypothetical protein